MEEQRSDDRTLTLFHDMQKRVARSSNLLLPVSDDFEAVWGGDRISYSPLCKIPGTTPTPRRKDEFLTADGDKNDYDWLLTPPGTPLFPSLEMEAQAAGHSQREMPFHKALPALKTSRLSNSQTSSSSKNAKSGLTSGSRQTTSLTGVNGVANATIKKSSTTTPKSASSSRSTTPLSKSTMPASKPSPWSSTPVKQSSIMTAQLSCTPAQRSSTSAQPSTTSAQKPSTSAQRSFTPSQRASPKLSQINPPGRSSSVSKASSTQSRNPSLSRGTSPTVKSRPLQSSAIPGFSLESPPNLRTEITERATSTSRGRPGSLMSTKPSTGVPTSSNKTRRQSCSPSITRGRLSNETLNTINNSCLQTSNHSNSSQGTMPAVVGSKMVERLMQARRSSSSQGQGEEVTATSSLSTKRAMKSTSSQQTIGFGSTLSKKSLDMALRHMDIRRGTPLTLKSHINTLPASSLYSVRSGGIKIKSSNKASSPVATSSNASSDYNARIAPEPEGSEFDDNDARSETGSRCSLGCRQDSFNFKEDVFKGDEKSTNWLLSPTSVEDRDGHSLFSGQGFEMLSDPLDAPARATIGFEYSTGKFGTRF